MYNVDDLAKYLAKIIQESQQNKEATKKNYVQYGVVRGGSKVEIAGRQYPAIFDAIDDTFIEGQGCKVMFIENSSKVLVIGR